MLAASIHYFAVSFCTIAAAFGVSRGQGLAAIAAFHSIDRQPAAHKDVLRTTILGLALIESAAIFGLLFSLILLALAPSTVPVALGQLGISFAIGIPGCAIGWLTGKPAAKSIEALARQPFLSRRITNFLLLVLSILETPLIFGVLIALMIFIQLGNVTTLAQGLVLLSAGITMGLGCLGPIFGGCHFTQIACHSTGKNRQAFQELSTFTFISQAIIETPIIFATLVSILLTQIAATPIENPFIGIAYLIFSLTVAIGTFGPGISSGRTAASTAIQIANNPSAYATLSRVSMMSQGLIDTIAVYAFIITLWLILTPPFSS